MKYNDKLNHSEIVDALTTCLRDIMDNPINHRNMPLLINRAKAVSSIVTSAHREEIMENKRTIAISVTKDAEETVIKKLKRKE